MRARYNALIRPLVDEFLHKHFELFYTMLQRGVGDLEFCLVGNATLNQELRKLMESNWQQLVDTTNAYWDVQQVTTEDKEFVYRRFKRSMVEQMSDKYNGLLTERLQLVSNEYKELIEQLNRHQQKAMFSSSSILDPRVLKQMRACIDELLAKGDSIAKLQLYLGSTVLMDLKLPFVPNIEGLTQDEGITGEEVEKKTSDGVQNEKNPQLTYIAPPKGGKRDNQEKGLHQFERKLRGGFVASIKPSGAFIPESIVRKMELQDGDLLRVVKQHITNGQRRHEFKRERSMENPQTERIQINYCVVRNEGATTYVQQYYSPDGLVDIRMNGTPLRFNLKYEDVMGLKLEEDDLIDIAFWRNNASSVKAIWKHHTEDQTGTNVVNPEITTEKMQLFP